MKKDFVSVIFVIDESGSMRLQKQDVIGGFNEFIDEQKRANVNGEVEVSLYTFNREVNKIYVGEKIENINYLSEETYKPYSTTSLNDAIGIAMTESGQRFAEMEESERPSQVIFVIMTDGEENSSRKYTLAKVKDMIQHQEKVYSWKIMYIGSELRDDKQASSLGIKMKMYTDRGNTRGLFKKMSTYVVNNRSDSLRSAAYTVELMDSFDADTKAYETKIGKKIISE